MARAGLRALFALDTSSFDKAIKKAVAEYDRRAKRAIKKGSLLLVREIKKELSKPGSGRARRSGKKKFIQGVRVLSNRNRASAPGEPPAVDTGRLRASIIHEIEREFRTWIGTVGTNVEYAPSLEFGTTKMAARPFMLITLTRIRPQLIRLFAREL